MPSETELGRQARLPSNRPSRAGAEPARRRSRWRAALNWSRASDHGNPSLPSAPATKRQREPLTGARLIIVASAVGFALFLLWAMLAKVDEVTAGQGKVIPSSKVQLIQSAEPATIAELLVRSGQRVQRGQLLARLDNPQSRSDPGRDRGAAGPLGAACRPKARGGSAAALGGEEATLSAVRRQALSSRVAALRCLGRAAPPRGGGGAGDDQQPARSLALAQDNVDMLEPLAAKNIVPQTELANARREVVDLQGRIAAAREQQGRAQAAVREAQSQASEARFSSARRRSTSAARSTQKIAVNEQSLRGARGRLGRMELRSPVDGVVNDVQVTTIGGFVQAGEKVMEVVPMGDKLLVETRVKPSDIAFIKVGDKALVKVTAYDFSTYGGLDGRVVQVSADSIYDEVEQRSLFQRHRRNRQKLSDSCRPPACRSRPA